MPAGGINKAQKSPQNNLAAICNTSVACQNFSSRALEKKGHTFLDRDLSPWVKMGSKRDF